MTTGSHAFLAVTSHEMFCFFLFLSLSYKPANDSRIILQLCHIGVEAGLANSQNMLVSYDYFNLGLTYLNH